MKNTTAKVTDKVGQIIKKFPGAKEVMEEMGLELDSFGNSSLSDLARKQKIPLVMLMNNLKKKLNITFDQRDTLKIPEIRTGKPDGVKNFIAVYSGKGGVGKTFVAIGLAVALARAGKKVGLLDLDIDCPNIPHQIELKGSLITNSQKKISPLEWQNIKVVSMGNIMANERDALMWRGPILTKALEQLIHDTDWRNPDVLIADLPPGTGDIPLTLFKQFAPDQIVLVTTPQKTSVIDTFKALDLARKMNIKVTGIIENMTGSIFGKPHKESFYEDVNYLGNIKLNSAFNKELMWNRKNVKLNDIFNQIGKKILFS